MAAYSYLLADTEPGSESERIALPESLADPAPPADSSGSESQAAGAAWRSARDAARSPGGFPNTSVTPAAS